MLVRSTHIYTVVHSHSGMAAWRPPTDMYETETDIVVQVEIAGMRDGHFHLSLQNQHLLIHGARVDNASQRRAYHQMEIHSGDFYTEVDLPAPVAGDSIHAEYDDGVLRITLPKLK